MGRRGPTGLAFHTTLLVAGALAACTSATGSNLPTDPPGTDPIVSETPPSSATPTEPTDEEAAAALWESVHTIRIEQIYSDEEIDRGAFAGLTTDDLSTQLLDLVEIGRGDIPIVSTASEFWPEVAIAPSGQEATISDCILVATRPAADPDSDPSVRSTVWSGSAIETSEGWMLNDITLGADDCVPEELNHELLAAYEAWHQAAIRWRDPPDPDHELLAEHMVDPGLEAMRRLLADHRDMGIVLRDEHDLENAVVFELGIGEARISDCFPAHPDNIAAYDQETGERREDLSPTPSSEQIDRTVVDLERTADGQWKVNGWRSTSNNDCTPGSSPYVVVQ